MRAASVLLVLLISGCASVRPAPSVVLPPEPTLPRITAEELSCISQDTYARLVEREMLLREYLAEIRALLSD